MIISGHYYYSSKGITGIILITNTNWNALNEIYCEVITMTPITGTSFQGNSTMADYLIHIGPSLSDVDQFIESNPEYFI